MIDIVFPPDHPERVGLANEVHARPPIAVTTPSAISSIALLDAAAGEIYAHVAELAAAHGIEVPADPEQNAVLELPGLQVKWERHGEFVSLIFVRPMPGATLPTLTAFPTAFDALPEGWLARLPGRTISAADIALLSQTEAPDPELLAPWFSGTALGGACVLDGAAWIFTDFVSGNGAGGRTRWLALDAGMGPAQRARVVQRVIEIETYRMVALLSLPVARAILAAIDLFEQRLEEITRATAELRESSPAADPARRERALLDELTQLAAEVEHAIAHSAFRFSAGAAYWAIVRSRITEFREQRVGDMRTLGGFLGRRMAPGMGLAATAAKRTEEVSARIERASTLLRTRVDVALEEQNQQLLTALDRRSQVSFRIQQAVEGLSIAAISYYGANLVELVLRPFEGHWHGLRASWIVAASIPVIAVVSWRVIERIRRELTHA